MNDWVTEGRRRVDGGGRACDGRAGNLSQVTYASWPAAQCVLGKDSDGPYVTSMRVFGVA